MASVTVLERLSRSEDPKKGLLKEIGDLSGIKNLLGPRVLVALYIGPEKMKSGLYRPTSQLKEDVYQSTVGLIVKKGLQAFQDDPENKFYGENPDVGEWVTFVPGEGKRMQINGVDCRVLADSMISMVMADPEIITHQ